MIAHANSAMIAASWLCCHTRTRIAVPTPTLASCPSAMRRATLDPGGSKRGIRAKLQRKSFGGAIRECGCSRHVARRPASLRQGKRHQFGAVGRAGRDDHELPPGSRPIRHRHRIGILSELRRPERASVVRVDRVEGEPPPVTKTSPPAVTIGPGEPATPSGGSFKSLNAGLFRIAGVSPSGIVHLWSPVRRSMAVSVPYGGLLIGSDNGRCELSRAGMVTRSPCADEIRGVVRVERVGFRRLRRSCRARAGSSP